MTQEEAKIIAEIAATANGGCSHCAEDLCDKLKHDFPDFDWHVLAGLRDSAGGARE